MTSPIIVPAVNAGSFSEVINVVRHIERELLDHPNAPTYVHIDVADGTLTPNVLWHDPTELDKLNSQFRIELHLMLADMDTRFQFWLRPHIGRYIVQFEGCERPKSIASAAKRIGKEFGFSIAPGTKPDVLKDVAGLMDAVQLLAVPPGRAGQKMDTGTSRKISKVRKLYPTLPISIDGGINADTARTCATHGAHRFVAASYLMSGASIRQQYDSLISSITNT